MKRALFIKSKKRNTLLSKPNFPVRSRFSRNMPSKPSFQGQRHLLILYLYLFMLTNKWRKGKRSLTRQAVVHPARQGCMQWPPKLLRTLQCTSSACSASVFGCFFIKETKNGLGWKGSYWSSHSWAGIPSTEQSITKDNLEKSDLVYTYIRGLIVSLMQLTPNANPGFFADFSVENTFHP